MPKSKSDNSKKTAAKTKEIQKTGKKTGKSTKKTKKRIKFTISGSFMMGDTMQKFQKEVEARSEGRAREKIYQDLGSKHRVKRSRVLIASVEEKP
jgi:large subunit ribosomal protein LX